MQVSIVIPNFNGRKLLAKNLPKVILAAPKAEMIVVDDASTDDSVEFVHSTFPHVKVIQHTQNKRFAVACNTGVAAAKGEIVILLNSDVVPKKNFLSPLLNPFKDRSVFSVGCKELAPSQDGYAVSGRTEGAFQRGFLVHWQPEDQESSDTLWTFGGSMAVDRKKYLQLGGMDELFAPAYWEDIDLCWRAKQRSWKMVFEKEAEVYHLHETTNKSVFGSRSMERMALRNQILFVWKNIRGWQLIEHILWLPYHFIFTAVRTQGLFIQAFFQAAFRWFSYSA